ncbi:MAG: YabP/YqfC family sporulation protein [Vescimonas sp.]
MAYEITGAPLHHRLELDGRERLTVSGVEDVARIRRDVHRHVHLRGELVVTGEGLHIGKLTLDGGELHVDGHIDSISYEEPAAGRTSLLSRLFG